MDFFVGGALSLVNIGFVGLSVFFMIKIRKAFIEAQSCCAETKLTLVEMVKQAQPAAWYPLAVAVVANEFQILPQEVEIEYKKEKDAREWIVKNVFPDNELTRQFMKSKDVRFLSAGYDFKAVAPKPAVTQDDKAKV